MINSKTKGKKELELKGNTPNDLRDQVRSVGYSFNYFYLEKLVFENSKWKQVPKDAKMMMLTNKNQNRSKSNEKNPKKWFLAS